MRLNRKIKKLLFIVTWAIIGCGLISLLIAANSKEQYHKCKEVVISVIGTGEKYFIGKNDISEILKDGANGSIKGMSLPQINISLLESLLEENPWIADAELYFDSRSVLHVTVKERQPIARVFTKNGTSFYIDSSGLRMPLLKKVSARVPVVTNFPSSKKLGAKDSILLNEIKQIAVFLDRKPFWNAQIAQVDVTDDKKFEFIPVIGSHIIRIGNGEHLDQKLNKLLIFYKQVLGKVGFDKYSVLDLQYDGQIVASHKGAISSIDSIQLKKNISELLKAGQMMQLQDSLQQASLRLKVQKTDTSTINYASITPEPKTVAPVRSSKNPTPKKEPIKTKKSPKPVDKTKVKVSRQQKDETKRPKAVMPKRG